MGIGCQFERSERSSIALIGAVLGCLALAGCAGESFKESRYSPKVVADGEPVPKGGGSYRIGQPYRMNGKTYVPSEKNSYKTEGIASWYGSDFHGRLTANGEVYDMHAITAAHPTMPLPSYARVTNLENGRSIIVRVNDRGPFARDRVADLSIGTAKALGFYGDGLARVRVEYVGRAPLEGSDDSMLLATLRNGSPAPVPGEVKLASAKSHATESAARQGWELASAPESSRAVPTTPSARKKPLLGAASPAVAGRDIATPQSRRVVAKAPDEGDSGASAYSPIRVQTIPINQATAFVPDRSEPAVDLMSARGLY